MIEEKFWPDRKYTFLDKTDAPIILSYDTKQLYIPFECVKNILSNNQYTALGRSQRDFFHYIYEDNTKQKWISVYFLNTILFPKGECKVPTLSFLGRIKSSLGGRWYLFKIKYFGDDKKWFLPSSRFYNPMEKPRK
jgi:hypothetical protein